MLLAGIVWLLLRTALSTRGEERAEPVRVLAVVSLSYLGTLVLPRTVIIFDPLPSERMLLPVLPVLVLLGAQAFVGAWQQTGAARALALAAVLAYAGLAMVLGARGPFLRFVYPDLGYIASSVQAHVPNGSCIAYERLTEEGLWTGRLVRLRLPRYRAVFVPDELLARSDVARALSDWGRATGCRYVVGIARPFNGGSTTETWAFRHDAVEVRLQAAHALSSDGDPMLEVAYRDSRVSILHLTDARPTLPAQR